MDRRIYLVHPSAEILNNFLMQNDFSHASMSMETFISITTYFQSRVLDQAQSLSISARSKIKDAIILYEEECPICKEDINSDAARLPCDHYFHKACVLKWFTTHSTCPLCRSNLDSSI